jgi:hypothetical protein
LSKCWSNCAKPNLNSPWKAPARDVAGAPCLPAAVPHCKYTPTTSGPSAAPWLLCVTLVSVLAGAMRRSPTRRTVAPPYTIGCSPLHVATPLWPCHAHAATPLTTVVTPSPRRTRLYKRPSPLQSSASASQSFFSCPPWPPVGELLPPITSISFRSCLSVPTSPHSPTETLQAVGLSLGLATHRSRPSRGHRLHGIIELYCRSTSRRLQPLKSTLGKSLIIPDHFPGQSRPSLGRISAIPAAGHAQGPNCRR